MFDFMLTVIPYTLAFLAGFLIIDAAFKAAHEEEK